MNEQFNEQLKLLTEQLANCIKQINTFETTFPDDVFDPSKKEIAIENVDTQRLVLDFFNTRQNLLYKLL